MQQPTQSPDLAGADAIDRLRRHVEGSIETKRRLVESCSVQILAAAERMITCFQKGGKILLCGNGGSAADAQHLAAEFVSVLTQTFLRPGMPAIALTTDSSVITASANDFGFEGIFSRQVQALGRPGDVLIGISTSGNSKNIVQAVHSAREQGIFSILLTGESGGILAGAADLAIRVPSSQTQYIQESHVMIGHILCDLCERAVFPTDSTGA
jgi:D-sedoheptulose 7-phosphate isomerase